MNYFIDTNIPLGYVIIHDKHHPTAKEFLEKNKNKLFWSNLVKKEYSIKFFKILDLIETFLDMVKHILKNNCNSFKNYIQFEKFILEKTKFCNLDRFKKCKILEHFWKTNLYNFKNQELYNIFSQFTNTFDKIYFTRDLHLNQILKLHNCGLNNYLKYIKYAEKLYDWGVHNPDCKIITDAHDCGLLNDNLTFITIDMKMLKKIIGKNVSFLKIKEFKSLN